MANSTDRRMKNRQKMSPNEGRVDIAAQPIPGSPQNQKGGNVANNPFFDNGQGQMFQQMGTEGYQYPYGDGGLPLTDGRKGAVGFVANSGQPQNVVTGQRQNSAPYGLPQLGAPDNQTAGQMELAFNAQQAGMRAGKLYAGQQDQTPSYQISGLGMTGAPAEMNSQQPNPGQIPPQTPMQSGMSLPLQGIPDIQMAQAQSGMNTGRGGGRNQSTQQA